VSQANIDVIAEVYGAFESRDFGVRPKLFDPEHRHNADAGVAVGWPLRRA
jgi:hypothetical protein